MKSKAVSYQHSPIRKQWFAHCSLLLLLTLLLSVSANAHTFHTTLARVEYNKEEQLAEITIQVFTHDIVDVLSRRSGKKILLDKTPDVEKFVLEYVREKFQIKNGKGEIKVLTWVGLEQETETTWLYVEAKMSEGLSGAEFQNKLFFELFSDQVNFIHFKSDGRKADLIFKPGDNFKTIPEKQN